MSTPRLAPHEDPGLQPERTTQSWLRTSLTMTVVSLLFIRWITLFPVLSVSVFVICIGLAAVVVALQVHRYRVGSGSIRAERGRPSPWPILGLTTSVCLIAVLGIASVIRLTLR